MVRVIGKPAGLGLDHRIDRRRVWLRLYLLAATSATASRQARRAGFSKSSVETSSQENSFTATIDVTSIVENC